MSNLSDYNQMLETIQGIDIKDVKQPNMPIGIFLQEGEDLLSWARPDKAILVNKGLDPTVVDNLPIYLGALREAQSRWNTERNLQEEAAKTWTQQAPAAYDLRDTLLHDFRFAFRNDASVLRNVDAIANGRGNADMIQDLNDLSVLGKFNQQPLTAIHFDIALLDHAAEMAVKMAGLLGTVNGSRHEHSELKDLRDRAFTLCKNSVDEIRACGHYAFWRNPERAKGYTSAYIKRKHSRSNIKPGQDETSEA